MQCACDDDNILKDLGVAAKAVTESLNDLLTKLKETQVVGDTTRSEEAYQTLVKAAESLLAASPQEMMQKARDLADVSNLRDEAHYHSAHLTPAQAHTRMHTCTHIHSLHNVYLWMQF